ncbi:MAG: two-component system, OmpR family, response regulator MprA [Frankiaceae bacterium]|nr:two-component system, OmpR family, response regulator MprA [Frankiaceae bacterium]
MRVLIADDEPAVRTSLTSALRFEGYEVVAVGNGQAAIDAVRAHQPELLILDVLMPRLDGLQTVRQLRAEANLVPVLLLTARDALGDRVIGLDAGADDYLVKPFGLEELLARVRALARRSAVETAKRSLLSYADIVVDLGARRVERAGRMLRLTRTEFMLLEMLMRHPEQVLTRRQLVLQVWGFDDDSTNSLDVYIGYLRRKTEVDGLPRLVHTERGVGFALRLDH